MRKLLIKFLLISGIVLTSHQTYGAEKDQKKEVTPKASRPTPARGFRQPAIDNLDDELDGIDREVDKKKQSYPKRFNAEQFQRILASSLKKQDAQSARWYKTERVQLPGALCWVSLIVNDAPEQKALIYAVHPILAEFIEDGKDYDSTAALGKLQEVEAEVDTTKGFSVYKKIFIEFQDLYSMDRDTGETAVLLKSKGLGAATSDGAIYKVMLGEKQLRYRMRDRWLPIIVRLNITYNAPKSKPSPIGLAEGSSHQGISAATRYLELPTAAAHQKPSKEKSHSDKKRKEKEKKEKKEEKKQ